MAHEALEEASSAKQSVQNYRKKLSSLKGRVEDVEVDSISTRIEYHSGSLDGLRSRKADESDVERVETALDEVENQSVNRLDAHESSIRDLREQIEELQDALSAAEEKNAELQAEIEEMQRGRLDRFMDRFADD